MGIRMGLVTGLGTQTGTGIGVRRGQRWRQGWGQGQSTPQNMLCQQEIHVVLSSSLEICWAHHCLLLVCPQLCHLFSSVTAEPSAAMAWEKLGMGWQGMGWPRELQTPCVCHRLCVCLRGAYTMPDSWVSHSGTVALSLWLF